MGNEPAAPTIAGGRYPAVVKLVVQRATRASVEVDGAIVGALPRPGLVVLIGVTHDDDEQIADRMAEKLWGLRVLRDEQSASDVNAPVLVVSQFTLYADVKKGRRPSWNAAAPRPVSEPLVDAFVEALRRRGAEVSTGQFGAMMNVSLTNDGPVTLIIDSAMWG